ncbi:hypothetical protein BHE74_00040880 [Ensete ventricosum]|uniref:Uncharacterized protein n=1 Tax=Ensete ventricosum TaxID=4639 RepID=A0A444C9L0_ENSVE|nr:hypothetical protein GW17_00055923 [Ensete ventricosum]RWW52675.1 hypothetical protein BHE74_00040880 [Ensete ventricosum]RZR72568.1 hypothetical protein BHM03_00014711 [Ensete ventricosum]
MARKITPSLESARVITLGIRAAFLGASLPFYSRPSSSSISQAIPTIAMIIADSVVITTVVGSANPNRSPNSGLQ